VFKVINYNESDKVGKRLAFLLCIIWQ